MKKLILMCLFSLTASALDSSGTPLISENDIKELDQIQSLLCSLSKTASTSLRESFETVSGIYAAKCSLADQAPVSYPEPTSRLSFQKYASIPSDPQDPLKPTLEYWAAIAGPALVASYDSLQTMEKLGLKDNKLKRALKSNISDIWSDLSLNDVGAVCLGVLYHINDDSSVNHNKPYHRANKRYENLFADLPLSQYWPYIAKIVYQFAEVKNKGFKKGNMLYRVIFTQLVLVNEELLQPAYDRAVNLLKHAKEITPEIQELVDALNAKIKLQNEAAADLADGEYDFYNPGRKAPSFIPPLKVKGEEESEESSNGVFSELLQSMDSPSKWERSLASEIVKGLSEGEQKVCANLWDLDALVTRVVGTKYLSI